MFKPWPGGRPTNAPTEAALLISNKYNIDPDNIEEITLHLSKAATAVHYSKPYLMGDYPPMNALWSFYYAVAGTLFFKNSDNNNFIEKNIRNPKLQELIQKVKLDDLERDEGIELRVKMKDGQVYSEYVARPLGEPSRPLPQEKLVEKFMKQAEFSGSITTADAEKAIELLEDLENMDTINSIIRLCIKHY